MHSLTSHACSPHPWGAYVCLIASITHVCTFYINTGLWYPNNLSMQVLSLQGAYRDRAITYVITCIVTLLTAMF